MASLDDLIASGTSEPSLEDLIGGPITSSTSQSKFSTEETVLEEDESTIEEKEPVPEIEYVRKEFDPDAPVRHKSVYCYGVQELDNAKINAIFAKVPPKKIEWIDDGSCNLTFESEERVAKFFKKLTRPLEEGEEVWKRSPDIVLKEGEKPRILQLRKCTVLDRKDRFHSGRVHSEFYRKNAEKKLAEKAASIRQKRKRDALDAEELLGGELPSDEIDISIYERGGNEEERAKRSKRAERFGDQLEESNYEKETRIHEERQNRREEELAKRKARLERFGITEEELENEKAARKYEEQKAFENRKIWKLKPRKGALGAPLPVDDAEMEKRKKRAERFGESSEENNSDAAMDDDNRSRSQSRSQSRPKFVLKPNTDRRDVDDAMSNFQSRRKERERGQRINDW